MNETDLLEKMRLKLIEELDPIPQLDRAFEASVGLVEGELCALLQFWVSEILSREAEKGEAEMQVAFQKIMDRVMRGHEDIVLEFEFDVHRASN